MKLWIACAFAGCLLPVCARAQWGPNQSRFLGVRGWTGTFNIALKTSGSGIVAGFPGTYVMDYAVSGTINADAWDPNIGGWVGKLDGTGNVSYTGTIPFGECTMTVTGKGSGSINTQKFTGQPSKAFVTLDLGGSDTYSFWFAATPIEVDQVMKVACPDRTTSIPSKVDVSWDPTNRAAGLAFPASGYNLSGQKKMPGPPGIVMSAELMDYDVTWNLQPTGVKELEVIVDPQGHDKWRPEAGKSEDEPGNKIPVKATLQWNDGSPLGADTRPQSYVFELAKASHEPGVDLNFPIKDAKNTADLQFREDENPLFTISGPEKQRAETLPWVAGADATAVVSSFDWGAWGELQVSAVMPGGQVIKGYLRGDKSQTNIRLPKRPATSKIADIWKAQKSIDKPDEDDSEKNPVGLEGCDGDGFTLYEEYRGFHENAKHIEGDPAKKDFFILNLVGAEAEAGIWLFTELTDLEVHKDLTEEEFLFQERLVNKNHDQGPHRVDQHGVYIATKDDENGATTYLDQTGVRGRPGLTRGILIQDRFNTSKSLGKQYKLSNADFAEVYDKAVAHELLHSIGVDHHGSGDTVLPLELVFPDDPANTTGQPFFRDYHSQTAIQLLDEKSRQDMVQSYYGPVRQIYDKAIQAVDLAYSPDQAKEAKDLKDYIRLLLVFSDLQMGVKSGEHSGDDGCIMRYTFSQVYQAEGRQNVYYMIPKGTEPMGLQLCTSATGTGVNQPGRDPQPRYFNAASGYGRCKFWVCPNDAIPPGRLP